MNLKLALCIGVEYMIMRSVWVRKGPDLYVGVGHTSYGVPRNMAEIMSRNIALGRLLSTFSASV